MVASIATAARRINETSAAVRYRVLPNAVTAVRVTTGIQAVTTRRAPRR
ncbi:uncharacterized protein METZ01_LOCUS206393, partial [marine metagenome]